MRILWLCNIMLPAVAEKLNQETCVKEGWLTGLAHVILERGQDNGIILGTAFPTDRKLDGCQGTLEAGKGRLHYYGFYEDCDHPEAYDKKLEGTMEKILKDFKPDVIHSFGVEYAHTLAMCRAVKDRRRMLVGIQGLCFVCEQAYMASLPERVQKRVTFRDLIKRDNITRQREKFARRGLREKEILSLAGNITGRTAFDHYYARQQNPEAAYFFLNETLRPEFYEGRWNQSECEPHTIFLSQGDYPLKGLHYMLKALPAIRQVFPDVKLVVAGNNLTSYKTWKDKLKLSSYGKFLRELIRENGLEERIFFTGRIGAEEMKAQYLKSGLYVCCSSLENSPNSLGEAMLLGMPCVAADVGGITSVFNSEEDGIVYRGYRNRKIDYYSECYQNNGGYNNEGNDMKPSGQTEEKMSKKRDMEEISRNLADAVLRIWSDENRKLWFCENARKHAEKTHNQEANYQRLMEIYASIKTGDERRDGS